MFAKVKKHSQNCILNFNFKCQFTLILRQKLYLFLQYFIQTNFRIKFYSQIMYIPNVMKWMKVVGLSSSEIGVQGCETL